LHAEFLRRADRLAALADRAARAIPAALAVKHTARMAKVRPSSATSSTRGPRARLRSA
jgi:hypothetical protein